MNDAGAKLESFERERIYFYVLATAVLIVAFIWNEIDKSLLSIQQTVVVCLAIWMSLINVEFFNPDILTKRPPRVIKPGDLVKSIMLALLAFALVSGILFGTERLMQLNMLDTFLPFSMLFAGSLLGFIYVAYVKSPLLLFFIIGYFSGISMYIVPKTLQ